MLPTHGRYDYSAIVERPDYSWPDDRRLAVFIALNIEHFTFGGGFGASLGVPAPQPDHRGYAWHDYGNRVGVWRLFELLDEVGLPAAILANSEVYDHCPQVMAAARRRGDEVVGHGRTNSERQGGMSEADEAALIAAATETIRRVEGAPPRGWLGPWLSQTAATPDLLKEAGYDYMLDWHCDDQPIWFRTRSGPILSVPYATDVNDWPVLSGGPLSGSGFADLIVDAFDEQLRASLRQPLVFGVTLHSYVAGEPSRRAPLRRALRHVAGHAGRAWYTRPGDIARHVRSLPAGIVLGS